MRTTDIIKQYFINYRGTINTNMNGNGNQTNGKTVDLSDDHDNYMQDGRGKG